MFYLGSLPTSRRKDFLTEGSLLVEGTDAFTAKVHPHRPAIAIDSVLLDIWPPAALSFVCRVTHIMAKLGAFATYLTPGHLSGPLTSSNSSN